jgi:hypothetical protein
MPAALDPLPPGVEVVEPGLDEVFVTRLSDPVRVRPAGRVGAVPFAHGEKRRRVSSGSTVHAAAGGRVEVAWPGEGLLVQMFDGGSLRIGVRERGEPAGLVHRLEKLRLELPVGTRLRLVDHGDLVAREGACGPLWLERIGDDLVRLFNNGDTPLLVEVGSATVELRPSQSIDLPEVGDAVLDAHRERGELARAIVRPDGQALRWDGELAIAPESGGVALAGRAAPVRFAAFGSLWELEPGERVVLFDDPSAPAAGTAAQP